jgi:hypothetical protein
VIGVMGPFPTIWILLSTGVALLRRRDVLIGVLAAITLGLFFLYNRSQTHGHPEFIALLSATTIGVLRCSGLFGEPGRIFPRASKSILLPVATALVSCALLVSYYPLAPSLEGFTVFMAEYDAIVVPAPFEQPPEVRTIALMEYPNVFWGVGDAWCRGSGNWFNDSRSELLDGKFGNVTCMIGKENPTVQLVQLREYNRVVFVRKSGTSENETVAALVKTFPSVAAKLGECQSIGSVRSDGPELFACALEP